MLRTVLVEEKRRKIVKATFGSIVWAGNIRRILPAVKAGCQPYPSIRATVQLVTEKFVWHSTKKDITAWSRVCVHCQRSKVHRHTKSSLG